MPIMSRVTDAFRLVRPRTLALLHKSTADLRSDVHDLTRTVKTLQKVIDQQHEEYRNAVTALQEQARAHADAQAQHAAAVERSLQQITESLAAVALGERQLRAMARAEAVLDRRRHKIERAMRDDVIAAHVKSAIERAPLMSDPMPHCVVDNLFPDDFYDTLVSTLPPAELFTDRPKNKQQLMVPFVMAPSYSRLVWRYLADAVAEGMMAPAVLEKFREPVAEWLRWNFPVLDREATGNVAMTVGDGRILLRTRGYKIAPHRDPKWGFITCLLYLARPGDDEQWGTQLYSVEGDEEAQNAKPHWIAEARCHLVKEVAFRRNRVLIFLNSVGAHGAHIPADAPPENLERYAYQFRIGPQRTAVEALLSTLPDERRQVWHGKVSDY